MKSKLKRNKGFLFFEVVIAICVLLILLTIKARLSVSSLNAGRRIHTQQICTAAALAQLDSISVTGVELTPEQVAELWQGVSLSTSRLPGEDKWSGLDKVTVTAERAMGENDKISLSQTRYIIKENPVSSNDMEVEDE